MKKIGAYIWIAIIFIMLCYILGTEFDYKYMFVIKIALSVVAGGAVFLCINEIYNDIQQQRNNPININDSLQNDIIKLRGIVESLNDNFSNITNNLSKRHDELTEKIQNLSELQNDFVASCDTTLKGLKNECGNNKNITERQSEVASKIEKLTDNSNIMALNNNDLINKMTSYITDNMAETKSIIEKMSVSNKELINELTNEISNVMAEIKKSIDEMNKNVVESAEDSSENINASVKSIKGVLNKELMVSIDSLIEENKSNYKNVLDTVKELNNQNSQYIEQMKNYQEKLMQMNTDDIELMRGILNGKK